MKRTICFVAFLLGFALLSGILQAAEPEFFKGKSVTIVVGNSVGGAQDDWARFIAQYLGKHIPGNPTIVVQNMPGAGTIIAANHIYNIAKPDGLSLGLINPGIYTDQLLGAKEVKFDWPKFAWIGSPERIDQVLFMRADTPYKTIEDIRKATEPPRCASLARNGLGYHLPKLLEEDSTLNSTWWSVTAAVAR
jgi:tripartite-type tricarboxylate transporter receptor subunit TctC